MVGVVGSSKSSRGSRRIGSRNSWSSCSCSSSCSSRGSSTVAPSARLPVVVQQ